MFCYVFTTLHNILLSFSYVAIYEPSPRVAGVRAAARVEAAQLGAVPGEHRAGSSRANA